MQYLALIHKHTDSPTTDEEWERFFEAAKASGMFQGGSEIGKRYVVGRTPVIDVTDSVDGYMRFDSDDLEQLLALVNNHPVIAHGGTIELCEMPKS